LTHRFADRLRAAIQRRRLVAGTVLPPTRVLAAVGRLRLSGATSLLLRDSRSTSTSLGNPSGLLSCAESLDPALQPVEGISRSVVVEAYANRVAGTPLGPAGPA
jgi:hypothetical protein